MSVDPLIGYQTPALRFEALLGKGAMGTVYRGTQLALMRPVAIKVIAGHLADDQAYIERFAREAQTLGRVLHPHVIACHDVGPCPGPNGTQLFVMVLEFVDGWSLGTLLKNRRLTVQQVLSLHSQAAEGLHAAHALGIIHRDIKPDNIMVTRSGKAKLADFGLAKIDDAAGLTQTGAIMGSPAYMSPEACRGEPLSPASDLYSLGCSLFTALCGSTPFPATSALQAIHQHVHDPIPTLASRRSDLAPLDALLTRCLAKAPDQRFSDAAAMARALRQAMALVPAKAQVGRAGPISPSVAGSPTQVEDAVAGPGDHQVTRPPHAASLAGARPAGSVVPALAATVVTGHGLAGSAAATLGASLAARPTAAVPPRSGGLPWLVGSAVLVVFAMLGGYAWLRDRARHHGATPATAATPAPTAAERTQADDEAAHQTAVAACDRIQQLIAGSQFDAAQTALDQLVLPADLAERGVQLRGALAAGLAHARQAASDRLDAAEDAVRQNRLVEAQQALAGLVVPEHDAALLARRSALRELLAIRLGGAALADSDLARLRQPTPGIRILAASEIGGSALPSGSPQIPPLLPMGDVACVASTLVDGLQQVRLSCPMTATQGGCALIVHGAGRRPGAFPPATLTATTVIGGVIRTGTAVPYESRAWSYIPFSLPPGSLDSVRIAGPATMPFVVARAAVSASTVPAFPTLQVVPGSLGPLLAGPQRYAPSLVHALHELRTAVPSFPDAQSCILAVPDGTPPERAFLARYFQRHLGLGLQQPGAAAQAGPTILHYAPGGMATFAAEALVRGCQFCLLYLPTSLAPVGDLQADSLRRLADALLARHTLLVLIVDDAENGVPTPFLRRHQWQDTVTTLRRGPGAPLPGGGATWPLPRPIPLIVSMDAVILPRPLTTRAGPSGLPEHRLALGAGLQELGQRLRAMLAQPDP